MECALRSKNSRALTAKERAHLHRVKELPCSVCGFPGPSDAHHIKQGSHYLTVALCKECHQDGNMGWHGARVSWKVRKVDEMDALNITLERLA
jgi:hypothetical protein